MERFEIPDDASELFDTGPVDYDIPVNAISDSSPDESGPWEADDEVEAITAPASADDGGSDGPPHKWDTALAEFPGDETILDMPQEEQAETMSTLDQYARGGQLFYDKYEVTHADDDPEVPSDTVTEHGYTREVPRGALEAEGLDYQVKAILQEATQQEPLAAGFIATRAMPVEVQAYDADGNPAGFRTVDGLEVKTAAFSEPTNVEGTLLEANGELVVPARGSFTVPTEGSQEVEDAPEIRLNLNETREEAPLLRLDEARAIMRAIGRADEFPEAPPTEGTDVLIHQGRVMPLPAESEGGTQSDSESALDMPEAQRDELRQEMGRFAESGMSFLHASFGVGEDGSSTVVQQRGKSHELSAADLAAEGLAYESASVVAHEATDQEPPSVTAILYRQVQCAIEVPTRDGLPVRREVTGEERRELTFTTHEAAPGIVPFDIMTTDSELRGPYASPDNPEAVVTYINRGAQPPTAAEAQALTRVLHHANNT